MGLVSLLNLALWANTLFLTSVFFEFSLAQQSIPLLANSSLVRHKRHQINTKEAKYILDRINEVEVDVKQSYTAFKEVHEYMKALGFQINSTNENPKTRNPCGNGSQGAQGQSETTWIPFGTSKCIKLISGLFTYVNANEVCRQQYRMGEDIGHPVVVSVDSPEKGNELQRLLHSQRGLTSVWVNILMNIPPAASAKLNCTEMKVAPVNSTEFQWQHVECERRSSVVCEKSVVVSYIEIVDRQLQAQKKTEEVKEHLKKATDDIKQLQDELMEDRKLGKELTKTGEAILANLTHLEFGVKSLEVSKENTDEVLKQLREELKEERRLRTEQVADMKHKEQSTVAKLTQVESAVASLNAANQEQTEEMQSLMAKFREEFNQQIRKEARNSTLKEQTLRNEVQLLQRQLRDLKTQTDAEKQLIAKELEELRRLVSKLETETSSQVSALETSSQIREEAAEKEDAGIKQQLEEIAELGQVTMSNLTRLGSAINSIEMRQLETDGQIESLQSRLTGLGEEVDQLNPKNESLNQLETHNAAPWQLGDSNEFQVHKATGSWYGIEGFNRNSKYKPSRKCWEDTVSLKGNNSVELTQRWRWGSNRKDSSTFRFSLDSQSPHFWNRAGDNAMWLKTDYDNSGIFMWCKNEDISSCHVLLILSRTRTLLPVTLEILRNVVEETGFPKENGGLILQTSC